MTQLGMCRVLNPPFEADMIYFLRVTIDLFRPVPPTSSYTFRSYNKMSPDEINMHLQECDWSVPPPPVSDLDIEQGLSMLLTNNVQGVIDLLAPEKTVHLIKKNSP